MKVAVILLVFVWSNLALADSKNEIQSFFDNLSESLNTANYFEIQNAWSTDGELITLAGGIFKGNENIKRLFKQSLSGSYKGAKFHFYLQYFRFNGEGEATVDGVWKITDGGPPNYPACGIFLYKLAKEDGKWKINMAYSSVPGHGHTRDYGRTVKWTEICSAD